MEKTAGVTRRTGLIAAGAIALGLRAQSRGGEMGVQAKFTLRGPHPEGQGRPCYKALAISPDGKRIAGGHGGGGITLWDAEAGGIVGELDAHGADSRSGIAAVTTLAFSPDSRLLASGGWDESARVWEVAARLKLATLDCRGAKVNVVAFAPDGKTLAVATGTFGGEVRLWDVETGRDWVAFRQAGSKFFPSTSSRGSDVRKLAYFPDGKTLAIGVEGGITLWDIAAGSERSAIPTSLPLQLAVAPSGGKIAVGGEGVGVRELGADGDKELFRIAPKTSPSIQALAFAPDGKTLALGCSRGVHERATVQLWDVARGAKLEEFPTHLGGLFALAYSPDGRSLATAGGDDVVRVWSLPKSP